MITRKTMLAATGIMALVAAVGILSVAQAAVTFTVNKTADTNDGICDADCSLREAITAANAAAGLDTIAFNIPQSDPGYMTSTPMWWRIQPTSALPTITDPVVIDGYTQPEAIPNTNGPGLGLNTVLKIELDGSMAGEGFVHGLNLLTGNGTVRGLAINRFGGNGIAVLTGGMNKIEGNFIGTDVTGAVALGNAGGGVAVGVSSGNTIGGAAAGAGNLISGNAFDGVFLEPGAMGNLVQGNFIGTDVTGAAALSNRYGVFIGSSCGSNESASSNNTIGGIYAGEGNVISGNRDGGVNISGAATGNLVQGNFIGTQADGTSPLGNSTQAVTIVCPEASNNTIGGTASGASNVIAHNGDNGVWILYSATTNPVLSNSIFSNGGLGIDLGANAVGVTTNDPGDADTGPNNLQNFPVLTSVTSGMGSSNVQGALNSTASTTFRVELFSNPSCDPSGYGEGKTFLGFADVITNGSGNANLTTSLEPQVQVGHVITATATDPDGNTSEFSQCTTVLAAPTPTPTPTPVPGVTSWGLLFLALAIATAVYLRLRRHLA